MKRVLSVTFACAAFAFLMGCSDKGSSNTAQPTASQPAQPQPAQPAQPAVPTGEQAIGAQAGGDPAAEAASLFKTRCVVCHGENGKGDGPTAAALNPKPRDYTSAEWQKSVTDDELTKIIVEGGPAVGKSPLMPANPDLKAKPEVVKEIVKIIRGFGPQG